MSILEILALVGLSNVIVACLVYVWLDDSQPEDSRLFDDWPGKFPYKKDKDDLKPGGTD